MNARRRYAAKRRRAVRRALADLLSARHVRKDDRDEVERFTRYLNGSMSAADRRAYEEGR